MTLPNLALAKLSAHNTKQDRKAKQAHSRKQSTIRLVRSSNKHKVQQVVVDDIKALALASGKAPPPASNAKQPFEALSQSNKQRKGSLVQVSLSNVKRFPRKLSIRSKRAVVSGSRAQSMLSFDGLGFVGRSKKAAAIAQAKPKTNTDKEAMLIGRQVVDAFIAQRQRQLRERELRENLAKQQLEQQLQLRADKSAELVAQANVTSTPQHLPIKRTPTAPEQQTRSGANHRSNVRKSFRDFKQLSRVFSRLKSTQSSGKEFEAQAQQPVQSTSGVAKKGVRSKLFKRSITVIESSSSRISGD